MSIGTTLFPPSNREAALVAFLRTFWQVVRATSFLGGAGVITVSATQLAHIDLRELAFVVGAILASAILSGLLAAGNILANGLPDAYAAAASAPVAKNLTLTPVIAPSDPSQPAAGVPPTVQPADPSPAAAVVDPSIPAQ